MFAKAVIATSVVSMFMVARVHAGPLASPLAGVGDYEKRAITIGLEYLNLELEPAPEGKVVGSIWVLNLEIFDPKSAFVRTVNYLHRTTRPDVIERDVLLRPGEPWDWEAIRETERNLRNPLLSILAVIVPVRAERPGTVDLLVVTRDSWSMRTDSTFEVQAGVLSRLILEPSEFNFLGLRKQVGARFDMDLGQYIVGPLYQDPNILGSRMRGLLFAGMVFNRQTGDVEGSASDVEIEYPLWSLRQEFGARIHASHKIFVSRLFQDIALYTYDAPETPDDDAIPWEFDMRQLALDTELVRAVGTTFKSRLALAHELSVQRPEVRPDFAGDAIVRQAFERDVLPRSERTSAMLLRYQAFRPSFVRYRNIETFDLPEDQQVGLDITLETAVGAKLLGSETSFVRLRAALALSKDLGGAGFLSLHAATSTRLEAGDANNTELDIEGRAALPPVGGAVRLIAHGRIARRFDDRQNAVFPVGGETGLRGYVIGAFVGPAMAIANLEVRTLPVSWGSMKFGANAFWDVGHAAGSLDALRAYHDLGAGVRVLVPQFGLEVLRIDWAFALNGPTAGFPGRLSIGYEQAF